MLDKALLPLRHRYGFEKGDKERVAAWILRHQEELQTKDLSVLAAHLDLFPLERWLRGRAGRSGASSTSRSRAARWTRRSRS